MFILMVILVIIGDIISRSNLVKDGCKHRKKFICVWSGTIMFLFSALHNDNVGIDMKTYYQLFRQDSLMTVKEIFVAGKHLEQGRDKIFHVLMHFLSYISDNPQIMVAFIGLALAISVCVMFYNYSEDPGLSILMFICFREFAFTVTGLRQSLSMALIFLSIKYIDEKKPIKFVITVSIAGLFHASALVFIFAYWIAKFRRSRVLACTVLTISVASIIMGTEAMAIIMRTIPVLGERFTSKITSAEKATSGITMVLIYTIITLIGLYIETKTKSNAGIVKCEGCNGINTLELNFSIMTLLFCVMSFGFADLYRMASYYMAGIFLMFPKILNSTSDVRSAMLTRSIVIVLISAQYILLGTGSGIDEYFFAWQ